MKTITNYKKNYKSKVSTCKLGNYCLKRMLYWLGIGFELLSTCLVAEVCQASNVFLIRKEPLSMTLELSKSMRWSNDHACFAMFDPLAHVLTFLTSSFLQVSKHRPVSPNNTIHNWHKVFYKPRWVDVQLMV